MNADMVKVLDSGIGPDKLHTSAIAQTDPFCLIIRMTSPAFRKCVTLIK